MRIAALQGTPTSQEFEHSAATPAVSNTTQPASAHLEQEVLKQTVEDLQSAAESASKDLMKLVDKLSINSTKSMDAALHHLLVQDSAAEHFQEVAGRSVEAGRSVVLASLELLDVLEEAEGLGVKVKALRNTVDGIVEQLQGAVGSGP